MNMHRMLASLALILCVTMCGAGCTATHFNVRRFGAVGDGKKLDTAAINQAIAAAHAAGGGTVIFPAGNYLSVSIHLRSNVALYLGPGATIVAADPNDGFRYDDAEPNLTGVPEPNHEYQDFGHSHWHNSLIWGENLENIAILGPGKIWGQGLGRSQPNVKSPGVRGATGIPRADSALASQPGMGNKAIALKLCRNVILRDFTISHGGWFGILATGVDNLTIDNLKIDTNRDGMDIDCCQNIHISHCTVNSPHDDAICLKSSYALGYARMTKNVTISDCQVSGFVEGSLLDGTYERDPYSGPTGRIKFGTESNGGFENIAITNCIFDYCRGLALETVDGAHLEDVTISNITMRDIFSAPIFIRLGKRLRGPYGLKPGTCQRININNINVYNADTKEACIISGIPHHDITDLCLSHISIEFRGGGTRHLATTRAAENPTKYPEPNMFGDTAAYGFFIRHAKNVELDHINLTTRHRDARSPFLLDDVKNVEVDHVHATHPRNRPVFRLEHVEAFKTDASRK